MRILIAAGITVLMQLGTLAVEPQLPAHLRPVSVLDQVDYCYTLVEEGEQVDVLESCFRHARLILDQGLRRRDAEQARGEKFEARLAAGVSDIARRLESFSTDDPERLPWEVRELQNAIRALRVELSRISAAQHMQISLVSRGGVSLGNWQAGFLYLVTEWAKEQPGDHAFSTVTGASAGAVNGFGATIEGCKPQNLSATDSLYYRIWMDLGLFGRHGRPGLFPLKKGGSTALSLFTNEALETILGEAMTYVRNGEYLPSCSVDFGFVTTHLDPSDSPVHVRQDGNPILTTKKLKEKFSVRLNFSDNELKIVNIGPTGASAADRIFYAGLGHEREVPLQSLLLGVRASGAFPAAFPPVPLTYVEHLPGPDGTVLPKKRVATFIDGGLLDNTPVGLAVTLDSWRDQSEPQLPHLEGLIPAEPRTYIFLEPSVRSWVLGNEEEPESKAARRGLISQYLGFARDLLGTATDAQLTNTAERFSFVRRETRDWTQPRLSVPERHMPITGTQFDHFMAFLERDFRIFDFYVGMADGYAYLERERCLLVGNETECDVGDTIRGLDAALQAENPRYRCVRAYYDSPAARVLERIGTEQLPAECLSLEPVVCDGTTSPDSAESVRDFLRSRAVLDTPAEDACIEPAISNHNFRALLAAMHNYKLWMQSDSYSITDEFDRFVEELSSGTRRTGAHGRSSRAFARWSRPVSIGSRRNKASWARTYSGWVAEPGPTPPWGRTLPAISSAWQPWPTAWNSPGAGACAGRNGAGIPPSASSISRIRPMVRGTSRSQPISIYPHRRLGFFRCGNSSTSRRASAGLPLKGSRSRTRARGTSLFVRAPEPSWR